MQCIPLTNDDGRGCHPRKGYLRWQAVSHIPGNQALCFPIKLPRDPHISKPRWNWCGWLAKCSTVSRHQGLWRSKHRMLQNFNARGELESPAHLLSLKWYRDKLFWSRVDIILYRETIITPLQHREKLKRRQRIMGLPRRGNVFLDVFFYVKFLHYNLSSICVILSQWESISEVYKNGGSSRTSYIFNPSTSSLLPT